MIPPSQIAAGAAVFHGMIFGVMAYVSFRKKQAKLRQCDKVRGEVIDVKKKGSGEDLTYHPVIRFKTVNGNYITFESPVSTLDGKPNWGERVTVLASRTDPAFFEIENAMIQWGPTLGCVFLSAAGFVCAPMFYEFLK